MQRGEGRVVVRLGATEKLLLLPFAIRDTGENFTSPLLIFFCAVCLLWVALGGSIGKGDLARSTTLAGERSRHMAIECVLLGWNRMEN